MDCYYKCFLQLQKKLLSNEAPSAIDTEREQIIPETSELPAQLDGNIPSPLIETSETNPGVPTSIVDSDEQSKANNDGSVIETSVFGTISDNEAKPGGDHVDTEKSTDVEARASKINGESQMEEFGDNLVENPPNAPIDALVLNGDPSVDVNRNLISEDVGTIKNIELSGSQTLHEDTPIKVDARSKDVDLVNEPVVRNKQHREQEAVSSAVKVQEQLEEVSGEIINEKELLCSCFLIYESLNGKDSFYTDSLI